MENDFWFCLTTFVMMLFEVAVWFIGPLWVGVLANVTLGKIPTNPAHIGRNQWTGALTAVTVAVMVIVLNQVRVIRIRAGYRVTSRGALQELVLVVLTFLLGLALTLFPSTMSLLSFPTNYQAFLLRLLTNAGVALKRDLILRTANEV
jgi:hypothetical protein